MALTLDDPLVRVQLFRFIDALPALKDAGVGPAAPGRVSRRGRATRPLVAGSGARAGARGLDAGGMAGRGGADRGRASWPGSSSPGPRPTRRSQTVLALRRRQAGLHGRPARRGGHQRGRGRLVSADLPGHDRRAGRPARRGPRGPPDRPRPARPDPAGQPLAQAVEPDGPLRADPRRGVDRARRRPAPADPPRGPRSRRLCPRRHGAVRLPGPDLRAVPPGARRSPSSATGPTSGSWCRPTMPEAEAELRMLARLGRAPRRADHDPAGQGGVLGLRGLDRPAAGLARAGLPGEVAERRLVRAVHAVPAASITSGCGRPSAATTSAASPTRSPRPRRWACRRRPTSSRCSTAWATPIQRALVDRGHRVRVYTPYGALLPGMAYLVRRLLENTSNESFLKAEFAAQRPDRRPAARPRGDRSHADPDATAQGGTPPRTPASCRRSATSRRPTSPGPRTARRCGGRSTRSAASSAGTIR